MWLWGRDPSLPHFTANSQRAVLGLTMAPSAPMLQGKQSLIMSPPQVWWLPGHTFLPLRLTQTPASQPCYAYLIFNPLNFKQRCFELLATHGATQIVHRWVGPCLCPWPPSPFSSTRENRSRVPCDLGSTLALNSGAAVPGGNPDTRLPLPNWSGAEGRRGRGTDAQRKTAGSELQLRNHLE